MQFRKARELMTDAKNAKDMSPDEALKALVGLFADPNTKLMPAHRRWQYDPEKQEFVLHEFYIFFQSILEDIFGPNDNAQDGGY